MSCIAQIFTTVLTAIWVPYVRYFFLTACVAPVLQIRIGNLVLLDSGSGNRDGNKNGSGRKILESLVLFFSLKILWQFNILDPVPFWPWDPGWKIRIRDGKSGSRILDKHPGSATPMICDVVNFTIQCDQMLGLNPEILRWTLPSANYLALSHELKKTLSNCYNFPVQLWRGEADAVRIRPNHVSQPPRGGASGNTQYSSSLLLIFIFFFFWRIQTILCWLVPPPPLPGSATFRIVDPDPTCRFDSCHDGNNVDLKMFQFRNYSIYFSEHCVWEKIKDISTLF